MDKNSRDSIYRVW